MRSYTSKLNGKSELIHQLREMGYSYRDIQRETGFSKGTISYHLGDGQKLKTKLRNQKSVPTRRQTRQDYIYYKKLNTPCHDCGMIVDPCALDYHHLDRETKCFSISRGINGNWSKNKIDEEIDKCILLCANCHRIRESDVNEDFYSKRRKNV